jgi:PPK2 family polyphosphate:nucleotide phosphotransferase
MTYAKRVAPGKRVNLAGIDPRQDGGLDKEAGKARLAELTAELGELQELLYAAGSEALLVVLQGLDTSGKDGTIRHTFSEISPLGARVIPFKVPTAIERAHDFLWRVHRHTPETGMISIFNRSHYEDVLVARVHDLVPEAVWRERYEQINAFEQILASSNTLIVKFYLPISRDEQEERLLARERDVTKAWKLSTADWVERRSWDDYIAAYEDALAASSTAHAPWYVVPADRKWFRNLAVAETMVKLIRPHRKRWLAVLRAMGTEEIAAIQEAREAYQKRAAAI